MSIFVTGTDTGCGKTYISALLIEALIREGFRVAGMKPVATGASGKGRNRLVHEDDEILAGVSNVLLDPTHRNPYIFPSACSPHIAAEEENQTIDLDKILEAYQLCQSETDYLVVEGVGGWRAPLNVEDTVEDLVIKLKLPVILVVGVKLGCINHALLTAEAIERTGLNMVGWIANLLDPSMHSPEENIRFLKENIRSPLLMEINYSEDGKTSCDTMSNLAKSLTKLIV